jgi:hypothetical protein
MVRSASRSLRAHAGAPYARAPLDPFQRPANDPQLTDIVGIANPQQQYFCCCIGLVERGHVVFDLFNQLGLLSTRHRHHAPV